MDGLFHGSKPYEQMGWFGGVFPILLQTATHVIVSTPVAWTTPPRLVASTTVPPPSLRKHKKASSADPDCSSPGKFIWAIYEINP